MAAALALMARVGSIAIDLATELVAPTRCAACDGSVRRRGLFCIACASTIERAGSGDEARCVAAFEYGGAVATAIARLKYQDRADLAPRLGRAMEPAARRLGELVDLVVPVPLHPRRLAERGYNQAALLAAPIARALGVTIHASALVRVRDTPQQVAMDRESRLTNVGGAFAARDRSKVNGRRVLLVDDVRTTGATLDGCARALHEVGAARVVALVLARRA